MFLMAGVQMQMLVRSYLTYELTGSASLVGMVAVGGSVPMLALSLFGGAIADRVERKRLVQVGQILNAVIALSVGSAVLLGVIVWYHLMIASLIQGVSWAFIGPARQAMIPQIVGTENLSNAIAMNASGMSAITVVAPAIAGILYALVGPGFVYIIILVLAIAAVTLTTSLPRMPLASSSGERNSVLHDVGEGLRYMYSNKLVLVILLFGLGSVLIVMPYRFLLPVFVVEVYERQSDSLGLLLSVVGMGSLVGSLFVASFGRRSRGLLLLIGGFSSGLALALISAIPLYYVAAIFMLFLGLGDAGLRALNQALVMEQVEDRYRGRVMSIWMLNFGLMPLGILPLGLAADAFGPRLTFAFMGTLMMLVVILLMIFQKRLRAVQ